MKKLFGAFFMALLGGIVSIAIHKSLEPEHDISTRNDTIRKTTLVNLMDGAPEAGIDYKTAAEMTINGVVHVKTEGIVEYRQQAFDPFREFFFGDGSYDRSYEQPVRGAGSGVIISEDGYLVTNNHVIENADKIKITLNNKKTYDAELVGRDPATDLAVLKIDEENLPFISYGNSDDLRVGEWVLAVGNPFNLTSTVTAGIVSAKGRDIDILGNDPYTKLSSIESFIQTDAAVNPGNSGGALVNTKGELIGINAAIKSNTGSFAGYSFAIPANIVKKVVGDLIEYGTVQRAFIGINIRNIDDELAKEKNIEDLNGVYVERLVENGSAEEAGIKPGDIVKKVEEYEVNSVTELQAKVGEYRPGDEIVISLIRGGKLIEKKVTLKNMEGNTSIITNEKNEILKILGATFNETDKELLKELGIESQAQIEELFPGKLRSAGVREGFIITKVGDQPIRTIDELFNTLKSMKGGVLLQGVYPNGKEQYYGLGM